MIYKTEHTPAGAAAFDQWRRWTTQHQYGRAALIGQGASLNAIEGTLRQTRRVLAPAPGGQPAAGVVFFSSMANSNTAVANNPHAIPAGQSTPRRPLAEFASALLTGKSVDGTVRYEDPTANPTPIFATPAAVPELAWKTNPLPRSAISRAASPTRPASRSTAPRSRSHPPAATRRPRPAGPA
jgi:hypothetical protein